MKCLSNSQEKRQEKSKMEDKQKHYKMVDFSYNMLFITLKVNSLNTPIKRQRLSG